MKFILKNLTKLSFENYPIPKPESQLIRAFGMLDKDGDGMISLSDLSFINKYVGDNLDLDVLCEVIMNIHK